jgi:putative transposase
MALKYKNKYRIPSARATWWNYGWAGAYFITICTHDHWHYFGKIQNGKMHLSKLGEFAHNFWHEIPQHSKNVELGAFVVMPNHVHGILILNCDAVVDPLPPSLNGLIDLGGANVETLRGANVETLHATSLRATEPNQKNESIPKMQKMSGISPKSNSVSAIIRSYKSAVTKHARHLKSEFKWQTRFYDRIIRNEEAYQRVSQYIENNPAKWEQDKFFKKK